MAYESGNGLIYVLAGDTFAIDVFNAEGEKTATLTLKDYQRVPFTAAHRKMILDEIRNNPQQKPYFETLKERLEFPDYWPAIFTVLPRGGKVYVMTYRREKGRGEFIVFDQQGRLLKRSMVPFRFRTAIEPYPTDIREGRLYQLVENDKEEWELHASPL